MTITHISERELALERENAKMLQTIRVQAAAIEELRTAHDVALQGWKCECSTDDACRFAKERDAFKADAERYAWVKTKLNIESAYDRYQGNRLWFAIYDTKSKGLDAAIDAAMKETK